MQRFISQFVISMLLWIILPISANAQIAPTDSIYQKTAVQNLEVYFNKTIIGQSRFFNGPFYQFYLPQIRGSAYFQDTQEFTNGSVMYDGFLYENVPLLYDLYRDILVSKLYDGNSKFSLVSEKVTGFKIHSHKFIYLSNENEAEQSIKLAGFYDLLYDGSIKVLSKRSKIMQEVNEAPYVRKFFVSKNSYFLEKNKVIYQFGKEASFLNLFKDEKADMKKFLKKNNIKFKENPEQAMVLLAKYYDSLPN